MFVIFVANIATNRTRNNKKNFFLKKNLIGGCKVLERLLFFYYFVVLKQLTEMRFLYIITSLVVVVVLMSACTTPIHVINQHPAFFDGRKVTVKGKVINTLHLDDLSFFTIKSGGNKMNVTTNDFLPVVGDNVKVHGTVDAKFYYQRDTILVIHEVVKPKDSPTMFNKVVN